MFATDTKKPRFAGAMPWRKRCAGSARGLPVTSYKTAGAKEAAVPCNRQTPFEAPVLTALIQPQAAGKAALMEWDARALERGAE